MVKKKFYAIRKGFKTGLFLSWKEAEPLVTNYKGSQFKSFSTEGEAKLYLNGSKTIQKTSKRTLDSKILFQVDHEKKYGTLTTPYNKTKDTVKDSQGKIYDVYNCPINNLNFALLEKTVLYNVNKTSFNWVSSPVYMFVDCFDNYSVIFDNYNLLKTHQNYRNKCVKANEKSATFQRKVLSLQYAYNYLLNKLYVYEEKYMNKKNIEKLPYIGFKKSDQSIIHAYCDGSSDLKSMGRGIYYDLQYVKEEDRNILSKLLKEHGGRPDKITTSDKQTNNIAELSACKRVFEDLLLMYQVLNKNSIKKIFNVIIHTDSAYSLFAIEKHLANIDLKDENTIINGSYIETCMKPYLQLKTFYKEFDAEDIFQMKWVPGHLNVDGNNKADRLAYNALKGIYVNNEISDLSDNDKSGFIEKEVILSTDSDSDIILEMSVQKTLEEDEVFAAKLCQFLKASFEFESESSSRMGTNSNSRIEEFKKYQESLENDYKVDLNPKTVAKKFPWIVLKAKLECNVEKFNDLRTANGLQMMIQEKQKEIKRYENQIINIQKIINANVGDNDLSGDTDNYQRIRQNKINLSSSKKMLDVVNDYITKKPTEISILSSENINHISADDYKQEPPKLKKQKTQKF